jgi:hypothetical protein
MPPGGAEAGQPVTRFVRPTRPRAAQPQLDTGRAGGRESRRTKIKVRGLRPTIPRGRPRPNCQAKTVLTIPRSARNIRHFEVCTGELRRASAGPPANSGLEDSGAKGVVRASLHAEPGEVILGWRSSAGRAADL